LAHDKIYRSLLKIGRIAEKLYPVEPPSEIAAFEANMAS
jgi:hypothetical protein